jgi:hypothetical protein
MLVGRDTDVDIAVGAVALKIFFPGIHL